MTGLSRTTDWALPRIFSRHATIFGVAPLTRRRLLTGTAAAAGAGALLHGVVPHSHPWDGDAQAADGGHGAHAGHGADTMSVDHRANGFDPHELLRDFDWGTTHRTASGRVVREWTLIAGDREIEIAPGIAFQAWTYN